MGRRAREEREKKERGETGPKRERPENWPITVCKWVILTGTCLLLFTPLIVSANFFFPFVGPKSLYFMGLSQIVFFAWLVLIIFSPRYRPRWNPILIALILFVAILILATVFGADPSRSFWSKYERMTGLLMWFHLLGFFVVISSVFQKREDWFKIFGVSIFVAILISLISLFAKIGVNLMGLTAFAREGATIGNTSFMGTYLLFNIFLALYLFLKSKGGLKIYSGIGLAIIGLGLLLSDARAAILCLFGGLILLLFLYLIFIPQKRSLNILGKVFLAASLIVFLISAFFLFQPDSFVQQKFIEKVTKARLVVWEGAWKGFQERPWLGWGPENFDFVFTKYFNPCMFLPECGGEIWFDRAHNIIFDTLVTSGIIGFLAYLGIFTSAFYVLWRKYFREKLDFWIPGIFSVILISYFVQNLTVFDMINSYLMFFLVLGFIVSIISVREAMPSPNYEVRPRSGTGGYIKLLSIVILILFLFSFSKFVIKPLQSDYYVIAAIKSQNSEERLSLYKKTLETSPLGKYQIRNFFAQNTLEELARSEAAKEIPVENFKQEMEFVSQELEKSIKESPLDFGSHLKLGQLYNAWARLDLTKVSEAEPVLEKAIELSPTNQQGYWALAQTKIYQGKFEEAISLAEKAVELEPRVGQSHSIVVQIAKFIGDYDLAEEKVKEAIEINPNWEAQLKEILGG